MVPAAIVFCMVMLGLHDSGGPSCGEGLEVDQGQSVDAKRGSLQGGQDGLVRQIVQLYYYSIIIILPLVYTCDLGNLCSWYRKILCPGLHRSIIVISWVILSLLVAEVICPS